MSGLNLMTRAFLNTIRDHDPVPADADRLRIIDEVTDTIVELGIESSIFSTLSATTFREVTTYGDTLFVMGLKGGDTLLGINPTFWDKLTPIQRKFGLMHESLHLIYGHVWQLTGEVKKEEDRPFWITVEESTINYAVGQILFNENISASMGKTRKLIAQVGVIDPYGVWEDYANAAKEQGFTPIPFERLINDDRLFFNELKKTSTKAPQASNGSCSKQQSGSSGQGGQSAGSGSGNQNQGGAAGNSSSGGNSGQSGQGNQPGQGGNSAGSGASSSQSEEDSIAASKILGDLHERAQKGDTSAQKELDALLEKYFQHDAIVKTYGSGGAGAAVAPSDATAKTFFKQLVESWISGIAFPDDSPEYNPVVEYYPELEDKLFPEGEDTRAHLLVAVDCSGSMTMQFIKFIVQLIGPDPDMDITFISFDGYATEFKPGEPMIGGGGTNFQSIEDYANEKMDRYPDGVLVYTDGFAPPIEPTAPDKWFWLVTPGGDDWMEDTDMRAYFMDQTDMDVM